MKKKIIGITLILVIVLSLGFATIVSAQEPVRNEGGFQGPGFHGEKDDNPIHALVVTELSEAFGISAEELEARLDAGERMYDIAAEFGYEVEDFTALMEQIHEAVTFEAVAQGLITQEQADQYGNRQGIGCQGSRDQFGMMNGYQGVGPNVDSPLHEYMSAAIAEAFGMSVEELEAAHEAGTPLNEILDLSFEDFREVMDEARETAISEAIADGVISEDDLGQFNRDSHNGGFGNKSNGGYHGGMNRMHEPGFFQNQPGN